MESGDVLVYGAVENMKLVADVGDLYALRREDLAKLARTGDKLIANLLGNNENSKKRPFWRLLYGLILRYIGSQTAQLLDAELSSLDAPVDANI